MNPFQVPATLEGASLLSEQNCMSLRFHTQETSPEEMVLITRYHKLFGYLLFKPNDEISESEVPADNAEYEGKSPSVRLRDILYAYFKKARLEGDFESFYRRQIEGICDKWKELLSKLCPECGCKIVGGVCQGVACKGRLL